MGKPLVEARGEVAYGGEFPALVQRGHRAHPGPLRREPRGHRPHDRLASPRGPTLPFGGWKQSGLGREGGDEGIHEYLQTKYTLTANPYA
jgi:hypothetical protein